MRRDLREVATMDEVKLEDRLNELVKELTGVAEPRGIKSAMPGEVQDSKLSTEEISSIQESLDYLRICVKYQLFDLEATRRENKFLRQLLEEREG
jgi:hypothetical protein